jgi:hypothetical protein
MLDILARVFDDAGRLREVAYARFEGDPRFVTAVALRFDSLTAVFRAMPDDDTLAASVGALNPAADQVLADVSRDFPWANCIGLGLSWAWGMTNQQGYTDGVRLEFGKPNDAHSEVVELVVAASSIRVFASRQVAPI